jgi:hypothetical protein
MNQPPQHPQQQVLLAKQLMIAHQLLLLLVPKSFSKNIYSQGN